MLFRSFLQKKPAEATRSKEDDSHVTENIDIVTTSPDTPNVDDVPPTPTNSVNGQEELPEMGQQSSEGMETTWEIKLDPRTMTVDCSCGFSMFRRFRNRR